MKTLTDDQVNTVLALIDAAGGCGGWQNIEAAMRDWDVDNPEDAVENVRLALDR